MRLHFTRSETTVHICHFYHSSSLLFLGENIINIFFFLPLITFSDKYQSILKDIFWPLWPVEGWLTDFDGGERVGEDLLQMGLTWETNLGTCMVATHSVKPAVFEDST